MTDFYGWWITHPASLLYKPGVELLSDDLENPAYDCPDVVYMVGSQRLEREEIKTLTAKNPLYVSIMTLEF